MDNQCPVSGPCFWPTTRASRRGHAQAGNHHDAFDLARVFAEPCALLEQAGLRLEGVFRNAHKDFDTSELRQACAAEGIETTIACNRRAAD